MPTAQELWRAGVLSAQPFPQRQSHPPHAGRIWPLGEGERQPVLFVPRNLPQTPVPLVVLLHGAGGTASDILPVLQEHAEALKFLILAPQSRAPTWDVIAHQYGPDARQIDEALATVFSTFAVDPERVAVAGFSDGASYALSLGLSNGQLFASVLAFSPGFLAPSREEGKPRIFISHGRQDNVLPVERCSRRIVPALEAGGYEVRYDEFTGGHIVPSSAVKAALDLFLTP